MADSSAIAQENPIAGGFATPTPAAWSNNSHTSAATAGVTTTSHLATRTGFLGLFIVVSFLGNLTLVATVTQSRRLRRTSLNLFVVSTACFNLVNCVMNMPLVMGATIKEKWEYGDFMCRMNSAFTQLTKIGMLLSLMCMAVDRLAAVVQPSKYPERMNRARVNSLIVYSWVQSFAFFIVIWVPAQDLPSRYYPNHYLCSLAEKTSLLYIILESILCFVIPFGIILSIHIHIIKICAKQKLKKKNMVSRQLTDVEDHQTWQEMLGAMFVGNLFIFWCIFEAPYIILNYINLYVNSKEVQSGLGSNAGALVNYPWQVDLAFTWMKLSYPMLLPIVTFVWRKDIWKKFKYLILCRKGNHVNDAAPRLTEVVTSKQIANHKLGAKNKRSPQEIRHDTYRKTQDHFNVPVLFATANGIHVQTYVQKDSEDTFSDDLDVCTSDTQNSKSSDVRLVKARKVDVAGSQADMSYLQMDGDTSDYDSQMEMDPYSISNPISVTEALADRARNSQLQTHELTTLEQTKDTNVFMTESPQDTTHADKEKVFDSGIDYREKMTDIQKSDDMNKSSAETIADTVKGSSQELRESTGNDSGTGSVGEQWAHNAEKIVKRNQEKLSQEEAENQHKHLQTPDVVDDLDSKTVCTSASPAPAVCNFGENESTIPINKHEKKKHKKKKKKSKLASGDDLIDASLEAKLDKSSSKNNSDVIGHEEMSRRESNNHGFVADSDSKTLNETEESANHRRRPARLKPLDYKSHRSTEHSPLRTPKILTPRSKLSKEELASLELFAHRNNDLSAAPTASSLTVQHGRSSSDDSQDNNNINPDLYSTYHDQTTDAHDRHIKSCQDPYNNSPSLQHRDRDTTLSHVAIANDATSRRLRRNTVDSQTALLGSNSSSDLSEIQELNARRKQSEVSNHGNTSRSDHETKNSSSSKSKRTQKPSKPESRLKSLIDGNTSRSQAK